MKTLLNLSVFIISFSAFSLGLQAHTQAPASGVAPADNLVGGIASKKNDQLVFQVAAQEQPTEWVHVFINTDGDADTGFAHHLGSGSGKGLDILIEGNIVYRYQPNDSNLWSWQPIPGVTAERSIDDKILTFKLPVKAIDLSDGSSFFAVTYSQDYAEARDALPRSGGTWKVIPGNDSAVLQTHAEEAVIPLFDRGVDRRAAFDSIGTYACYYGKGMVEELSERDAAIIEIKNQSLENIRRMQEAGTLVIGYISIGEDDELRIGDNQGPGGYDSGYFDRDNNDMPDKNKTWNSYYADSAQPAWRRYFLDRAWDMRRTHGVDGFFLDTVDTSEIYPASKQAMLSLIKELRAQNPESIIILNRGFHTVEPLASTVDGVMFESFTASWDWGLNDYILMRPSAWDWGLEVWQKVLKPAMDQHGIVVLVLDYAAGPNDPAVKTAFDRAATFGFVPEVANIYLDQIYDIDYEAQPDERYLQIQTTPENMSFRLEEPRNGFPEGTLVLPSSLYPDYAVAAVVDGVDDKDSLNWRHRAWASFEKDSAHSLEFRLPRPVTPRGLAIDWAWDSGEPFYSRDFRVEVKPSHDDNAEWQPVAVISDNENASNRLEFNEPSEVVAVRIVQEPGNGSERRPNLMWIERVSLLSSL